MIKTKRAAFSLIEMLVAIVLLTLLLGVALFSFRHLLITFKQIQKSGIHETLTYNSIRSTLESVQHYVVDDYNRLNQPAKNLHFYFQGESQRVRFITTDPNFSDTVSLAQLECRDSKLIYSEEKLYGPMDFRVPNFSTNQSEKVMYDALQSCEFFYYAIDAPTLAQSQLHDTIPKFIELTLRTSNQNLDAFIAIKSDNNSSVNITHGLLYDEG
jgi:prepilin-type N-terminal cleavage/methylation domain-containing protein